MKSKIYLKKLENIEKKFKKTVEFLDNNKKYFLDKKKKISDSFIR